MSKNDFDTMINRSLDIRKKYHELELQPWKNFYQKQKNF